MGTLTTTYTTFLDFSILSVSICIHLAIRIPIVCNHTQIDPVTFNTALSNPYPFLYLATYQNPIVHICNAHKSMSIYIRNVHQSMFISVCPSVPNDMHNINVSPSKSTFLFQSKIFMYPGSTHASSCNF